MRRRQWLRRFQHMVTTDRSGSPREVLRKHRSAILALLDERGVRDVRVYGSLARGEEDVESDIDLLVELPDTVSAGVELLTALGLAEELSQLVRARVDVATPRTLRDEVRDAALAEAIPL
ncbi:nucleotidyltransferase family protein [Gaiella sp.]|uniref:nucleotidyltransferase family protein n=1 Tax=Gaiella sp. TaxID=2663207 RepID=UPI002E2F66C9|nr:nucleotidyltransferase domain-containing protein [Gaiella sp.]HEX5583427.1 nucleotidyltransferase domain-containing protein [Gaiella sp.]